MRKAWPEAASGRKPCAGQRTRLRQFRARNDCEKRVAALRVELPETVSLLGFPISDLEPDFESGT